MDVDFYGLVNSKLVVAAGCFYLLRFLFYLFRNAWFGFRNFIWSRLENDVNLRTKYGEWAIVTGSTDGIGKEWAKQLAKRRMNIILISRNESKLQATEKEIRQLYGVDVKWIQADFKYSNVYSKISKELEGLDIGILVNNVGTAPEGPEPIVDESEEFLNKIINVNIKTTILLTSLVIKQMQQKKRGLIINISSLTALIPPVPFLGVYGATKAFMNYYSSCLKTELEGSNIDVKCFCPAFVNTQLLSSLPAIITSFKTISPSAETYVASAIATLNTDVFLTSGYWVHSLVSFLLDTFVCRFLIDKILLGSMTMLLNNKYPLLLKWWYKLKLKFRQKLLNGQQGVINKEKGK